MINHESHSQSTNYFTFKITTEYINLSGPITNKSCDFIQREITDIKQFVELARRADVKKATVKINYKLNAKGRTFKQTKFKIRGAKYLYTLIVNDATKAKKLTQSLPPTLKVIRA